jgi:hypothetical protein
VKQIPLKHGLFALVDDDMYDYLIQWNWRAERGEYAIRTEHRKRVWMHRVITNAPEGMEVDHRDGNGLNNRRGNLRICTKSQNMHNTPKRKDGKNKYRGVHFRSDIGKYEARISVDKSRYYLGVYDTAEDAAEVYNKVSKKYLGEFRRGS